MFSCRAEVQRTPFGSMTAAFIVVLRNLLWARRPKWYYMAIFFFVATKNPLWRKKILNNRTNTLENNMRMFFILKSIHKFNMYYGLLRMLFWWRFVLDSSFRSLLIHVYCNILYLNYFSSFYVKKLLFIHILGPEVVYNY